MDEGLNTGGNGTTYRISPPIHTLAPPSKSDFVARQHLSILLYCNREFDDEKILIQHQKAKHFKCHICYKKLYTGPGLAIHCMQVHKEKIDKVPNSLPGRNNTEIEIYGMEGIPEEDVKAHEKNKNKKLAETNSELDSGDDSNSNPPTSMSATPMMNGMPMASIPQPMPFAPGMPSMPNPMMPGPMGGPMMNPMGGMPGPMMGGPMGGMAPMGPMGMGGPMMRPGMNNMGPMNNMNGMNMQRPPMPNPNRPLFPAAAQSSTSASSSSMGTVRPTFPAAATVVSGSSNSATITGAPTIKKPESTSGLTSKLVHPDEDISLEELRANMPKYLKSVPMADSNIAGSPIAGSPLASGGPMPPGPMGGMNMGMNMGMGGPNMMPGMMGGPRPNMMQGGPMMRGPPGNMNMGGMGMGGPRGPMGGNMMGMRPGMGFGGPANMPPSRQFN
nr:BUB3-interacting and GLEBS motif-containing protein ZNF207-like isoform X1 [Biomphalaria glabrata]